MKPVVIVVSILQPVEGGIELLLASAYQIPTFFGEAASIQDGFTLLGIPDNATASFKLVSDGSIASATVESLHILKTNANYQVVTTGSVDLVVEIEADGSVTNGLFKVFGVATGVISTQMVDF